jgi:hypothetical protein
MFLCFSCASNLTRIYMHTYRHQHAHDQRHTHTHTYIHTQVTYINTYIHKFVTCRLTLPWPIATRIKIILDLIEKIREPGQNENRDNNPGPKNREPGENSPGLPEIRLPKDGRASRFCTHSVITTLGAHMDIGFACRINKHTEVGAIVCVCVYIYI